LVGFIGALPFLVDFIGAQPWSAPFVNFEIGTDDLSFSGIDLRLFPIVQRSETRM
jgi:hypothetical protein